MRKLVYFLLDHKISNEQEIVSPENTSIQKMRHLGESLQYHIT